MDTYKVFNLVPSHPPTPLIIRIFTCYSEPSTAQRIHVSIKASLHINLSILPNDENPYMYLFVYVYLFIYLLAYI